jgi:uncharacterized membrane protein
VVTVNGVGDGARRRRRFAGDAHGNVAIMAAMAFAIIALFAMFAVDLGMIYLAKRQAQGAVDIAAELAAQDIPNAEPIVRATLARNDIAVIERLRVTPGGYVRDPAIAAGKRFAAGARPANAVKVVLRTRAGLGFARFLFPGGTVALDVQSIGAARRAAALSIGSRLVNVDGGILNAVLGATLGGDLSLNALDYRALADTRIDLFGFLDALATRAHVTAGTYDALLDTAVAPGDLLAAAHDAIVADPEGRGGTALRALADAAAGAGTTIQASRIIALGDGGAKTVGASVGGLSANVSALSLISAVATVAGPDHQLTLDAGIGLPGVAGVTVDIQIGERPQSSPWLTVGEEGAGVRTAQVRAALRVKVGGSGLLSVASIDLPIVVEVAPAEARLTDIDCADRARPRVEVQATPGIVSAWIGQTTPFSLNAFGDPDAVRPAHLLDALGIAVTGKAQVRMASMDGEPLTFTWDDIARHAGQTVTTRDYTRSLVASLLNSLDIQVSALGIPLVPVSAAAGAVLTTLRPLTGTLDGALNAILAIAGVNLGQADVWVDGARCNIGLVG